MVEHGLRADDPRFAICVHLDALVAVTGLTAADSVGLVQGHGYAAAV
jgi:hypothetical protein